MFTEIGKKIKNWARAIFVIEAICAIIAGLVMAFSDSDMILYGLLTAVAGFFVAWVSTWLLYGFGELVDKVCDIEVHLASMKKTQNAAPAANNAAPAATTAYAPVRSQAAVRSTAPVPNGWTCTCGRNHPSYETSCICGVTKRDAMLAKNK